MTSLAFQRHASYSFQDDSFRKARFLEFLSLLFFLSTKSRDVTGTSIFIVLLTIYFYALEGRRVPPRIIFTVERVGSCIRREYTAKKKKKEIPRDTWRLDGISTATATWCWRTRFFFFSELCIFFIQSLLWSVSSTRSKVYFGCITPLPVKKKKKNTVIFLTCKNRLSCACMLKLFRLLSRDHGTDTISFFFFFTVCTKPPGGPHVVQRWSRQMRGVAQRWGRVPAPLLLHLKSFSTLRYRPGRQANLPAWRGVKRGSD